MSSIPRFTVMERARDVGAEDGGAPPRLLFLCHTLPYPPDGGVWIRSYHVLAELARHFDVTALCFERTGERGHDTAGAVEHLNTMASTEAFEVPQDESSLRKVLDHLRSLATARPFTFYKHRSAPFERRLASLLTEEKFDLVHVDSLDLVAYLPTLVATDVPVVCVHHNIESRLLARRAEAESNPAVRWYVRHQARLQEAEERRWCGQVDLNVVVSPEDGAALAELVPEASIEVVPNGVDTTYFAPEEGSEEGIVFVGSPEWFPNRDGMLQFCRDVLPEIRRRFGETSVTWVGSAPDSFRDAVAEEFDVEMTGYVEDVRPYVHRAACYVVPLRVGGGSRLKILDAWAMGKAVVSTSVGCEGLDARDGENILVRDDPRAFAESVEDVLHRDDLRRRLGEEARETVEKRYAWRLIGEKMNRLYRGLAGEEVSGVDDASRATGSQVD